MKRRAPNQAGQRHPQLRYEPPGARYSQRPPGQGLPWEHCNRICHHWVRLCRRTRKQVNRSRAHPPRSGGSPFHQQRDKDDANEVLKEVHHNGRNKALPPHVDEGESHPYHPDAYDAGRSLIAMAE